MAIQRFIPPTMGIGKGRKAQTTPAVNITVGKTARFHFNVAALLRYLGDKTCVEYFYDDEKSLIGFKFYKDRMPNTYTLTMTKIGSTSRVVCSASAFLDSYKLRERLRALTNRTFVLYTADGDDDLVLCKIDEVNHAENSGLVT